MPSQSRVGLSLWDRLLGASHDKEEAEVTEEQIEACIQEFNEKYGQDQQEQPITSADARRQLTEFMTEMRQKSRAGVSATTMESPFASSSSANDDFPVQSQPPPPADDLRVPSNLGEPQMVYIDQ